jgi:hypothetical protein
VLRLTAPDEFLEEKELSAHSTVEYVKSKALEMLTDFASGLDPSVTLRKIHE